METSKEYLFKIFDRVLGIDKSRIKDLAKKYYGTVKFTILEIANNNNLSDTHKRLMERISDEINSETSIKIISANFYKNFYEYLLATLRSSFASNKIFYSNEKITVNFMETMMRDNLNSIIRELSLVSGGPDEEEAGDN